MDNGFGSPYVKLWGQSGKELTDIVTSFTYVHSEEEDDECVIVLESQNDTTFPDNPDYQDGKAMRVQWGYMGKTPQTRIIILVEAEGVYNETKISLILKGYDQAFYLKHSRTISDENGLLENPDLIELGKKIADNHGLEFVPPEESTDFEYGASQYPLQTLQPRSKSEDNKRALITQYAPEAPKFFADGGIVNSGGDMGWLGNKQLNIPIQIVTKGYTDFQVLRKLADKQGEEIHIVGHDNKLGITYRNFNQKPIYTYKYADEFGELLSFKPELKNRKAKAAASSVNYQFNNPTDKTNLISTGKADITNGNQPIVLGEGQNQPNAEKRMSLSDSLYIETGLRPSAEYSPWPYRSTEEVIRASQMNTNKDLTLPTDDKIEARLLAEKDRVTALSKQNIGMAEVVGNPILESGRIVRIENVSEKYSGNWYIVKAVHTLTASNGYRTQLSISRNALSNKAIGEMANATDFALGVSKQIQEARQKPQDPSKKLPEEFNQ